MQFPCPIGVTVHFPIRERGCCLALTDFKLPCYALLPWPPTPAQQKPCVCNSFSDCWLSFILVQTFQQEILRAVPHWPYNSIGKCLSYSMSSAVLHPCLGYVIKEQAACIMSLPSLWGGFSFFPTQTWHYQGWIRFLCSVLKRALFRLSAWM